MRMIGQANRAARGSIIGSSVPAETSLIITDTPWISAASATAEEVVVDADEIWTEFAKHWKNASDLLVGRNGQRAGPSRFAADVDQVSTVALHRCGMSDGGVG